MSFLNNSQNKCSILITGGCTGIGLQLAKTFLGMGHGVIVLDKHQEKLDAAKAEHKDFQTIHVDIASDEGRKTLKDKILSEFPQINVLINNAVCLPQLPPLKDTTERDWELHKLEFQTNLIAPMHLSALLLPHLQQKPNAMIMNVTSIFAFFPLITHPTYCANKAALHSFTQSLRFQLRDTSVRVVELIPPVVESPSLPPELKGKGIRVEEFVEAVIPQLTSDKDEITHKDSEHILRASRDELDALFDEWNGSLVSGTDGAAGTGDGHSSAIDKKMQSQKSQKSQHSQKVSAGDGAATRVVWKRRKR